MSLRRLTLWLALAGGILLLAGALYFDQARLVVYDAKADRVLLSKRVRAGDSFTLSYLHSVAKSRVSGRFEVDAERGIVARETSFGSFGPGLPEVKPGDPYRIEDGVIRLAVDQAVEELSFFVHPFTEHVLETGAVRLELSRNLPPGSLVKASVERVSTLRWLALTLLNTSGTLTPALSLGREGEGGCFEPSPAGI